MKTKALAAAAALLLAAPVMAATCTSTKTWGPMGPPGSASFSQTFYSNGSYLDCYTFSLTSLANTSGVTGEFDNSFWLDIDIKSVSLFAGGVLGGGNLGSFVKSDDSPAKFSFDALTAGTYTIAVASRVYKDFEWNWNNGVGYTGKFSTTAASIASPAPEPGTMAMMLLGLAGVGAVARRRQSR